MSIISPVAAALIDPLSRVALDIIERIWPDPQDQAKAKLEFLRLQQEGQLSRYAGEVQVALAQANINQVDATSSKWYQAAWRPFIGWVCGVGLTYQFLFRPLLVGFGAGDFPQLDDGTLIGLLTGMLGLVGARTTEKLSGRVK